MRKSIADIADVIITECLFDMNKHLLTPQKLRSLLEKTWEPGFRRKIKDELNKRGRKPDAGGT